MKRIITSKVLALMAGMLFVGIQPGEAKLVKPSGGSVSGNVVISKVFYSGSVRLNGEKPKNYMNHLYVELYNNSADTLNLQGMYIALANTDSKEAAWTASAMAAEHKDSAVVKQIFQIPDDVEYRMNPGQSVVFCNSAIDHSSIAEGGVDLSTADFEVKSENKNYKEGHNSDVPELKIVSTFGTTDFINFLNPGPDGIILLAADTKLESCPKTFKRGSDTGNEYTIVPLFKSIDCVDIVKQKTPSADDKRFAESYDAGFTCTADPGNFTGQAVVRKTAFVTSDGRVVLFDTNNSSVDFETTTDLTPRSYSKKPVGLDETMTITIPESGYLAINPEKPFCASKELTFCYLNVSNNASTTDMKYSEYPGDSLLLIAGPWIAIGQPGTYMLRLSSSQGVMKTRSSGMTWSDEDSKTLTGSQASRMIYKFSNEKGNVGFKRVVAVDGKYNTATFSDGDRLYYALTTAIADKIAAANGATSNEDLNFIQWHGAQPVAAAFEVEANNVAEFVAVESGKVVKFNLKDVRVNAYNPLFWLAYVEDETGVAELNLKRTGITFNNGDVLNGYIIGEKEARELDFMGTYPDMKEHLLNPTAYTSLLTLTAAEGEVVAVASSVADAAKEGNHGRVMTISNVTVEKSGRFFYAISGEDKIQLNDELGVQDYEYNWAGSYESITGVVTYNGVRWQIAPLTAESVVTGISTVSGDRRANSTTIYNLQGVKLNKLQKGLNILNGKKVVVR